MPRLLVLLLALLVVAPNATAQSNNCPADGAGPGDTQFTVVSGGRERIVNLHVPTSYKPGSPAPLVMLFHGLGSNATDITRATGMREKSDAAGFILAAPEGVKFSWNAGECCGGAMEDGVDDVAFVRDMVKALSESYCVDARRIYSTGFSNGGFLSLRLACEAADLVAAVAPVGGALGIATCKPSRAVPVLIIHGKADARVVPARAEAAQKRWAGLNGCKEEAKPTLDRGTAHCATHPGCRDGAEVSACWVDHMAHSWPGIGPGPHDLVATDALWDFFKAHPRQ